MFTRTGGHVSRPDRDTMTAILYLLLPLSLLFVLAIGVFLWWAIFSGQYDDPETDGAAILHDDDGPPGSG